MAEIRYYPFVRHLRADASTHVIRFSSGRKTASGRGLTFYFLPDRTSVAEIAVDDRDLTYIFTGRSKDYQALNAQGTLTWRVDNPEQLADRVDFNIDLKTGLLRGEPRQQIETLLTGLAQQASVQYFAERTVAAVLEAGVKPLQERIAGDLTASPLLTEMGLRVIAVRVTAVTPSADLEKALQTPTFEQLLQKADEASFSRRALAVDKERAIAENELANQTELAKRQMQLIAEQSANSQAEAEAEARAMKVKAYAEADRITTLGAAKAEAERAMLGSYKELEPQAMLALAAREFATKLNSIENLNITPDLLATLVGEFKKAKADT